MAYITVDTVSDNVNLTELIHAEGDELFRLYVEMVEQYTPVASWPKEVRQLFFGSCEVCLRAAPLETLTADAMPSTKLNPSGDNSW